MAKKTGKKRGAAARAPKSKSGQHVYFFGSGKADGNRHMKDTLGGKGSGLAEMTNAGLPVPPGFTISTGVCTLYYKEKGKISAAIDREIAGNLKKLEKAAGATLGSHENPLLVSVRSGAKFSMPGMMDTILNLGLNDKAVEGLKSRTQNGRFAYDSYRRFMPHLRHPRSHRHGGERADDGIRQHRRSFGHGRRLHAQSGHRQEGVLRRVPDQRPG
jgi:hypothetical protein